MQVSFAKYYLCDAQMQIMLQSFSPSRLNAYFIDRKIGWALTSNFEYIIMYIENYGVYFTRWYHVLTCDCTPLETRGCFYHQRPSIYLKNMPYIPCSQNWVTDARLNLTRWARCLLATILLYELNQNGRIAAVFPDKIHPADKLQSNKWTCLFWCIRIWYVFPQ